jgi:hypothetical protein
LSGRGGVLFCRHGSALKTRCQAISLRALCAQFFLRGPFSRITRAGFSSAVQYGVDAFFRVTQSIAFRLFKPFKPRPSTTSAHPLRSFHASLR